jgi:AraC family transcriptional regulator, transcriptional activator of pobA
MSKIPVRQLKESFAEERFSIRDIDSLTHDGNLIHNRHRHDFYFALFVKKGSGVHEIDFVSYEINDHSAFFMRPGQVHQLVLQQGASGFLLQFTHDFYAPRESPSSAVLRKASNLNHCPVSTERFEKVHSILHFMLQELAEKQERYKEAIRANLEILMIELLRQNQNPHQVQNAASLYASERMESLMELLEKNFTTHKQVSQYAEMLNLTSYQLNAITKKTLDKTCSEIINEHIILEAKRLLIATPNQVNQIADLLGYDDPSYFIRFFKKHTGHSPEVFRHSFK